MILGTNDDDEYTLRVIQRIARRQGGVERTDVPGIIFLEIDGLALPVLRAAMRDGSAPNMARWLAEDGYRLAEWETDLSSQTGASQAGILLGSNEDIPAFRWVEKETGRMMTCSVAGRLRRDRAPPLRPGSGLLVDGGASRGNLLSGEADEVILTVSRIEAEKQRQPRLPRVPRQRLQRHARARAVRLGGRCSRVDGRAARGAPRRAAARAPRRHLPVPARGDVRGRPRPDRVRRAHRHDARPPRGLRDVLELRRGRAPLRARARRHARGAAQARPAVRPHRRARAATRPRPYEIVVLSDHGQTQGATFKQRNGYGLDELVERSLASGEVAGFAGGDEQNAMVGHAVGEATGAQAEEAAQERRLRPRGRRPRLGQPRAHLPDGGASAG